MLLRATWRGQGVVQAEREKQDLGSMHFFGPMGGLLQDSWAKTRLVNLNQKEWSFGKIPGVSYLRGAQRESPGVGGELLFQGLLGKLY